MAIQVNFVEINMLNTDVADSVEERLNMSVD